jgi:uncharacterized protein YbjQ (UPF0145 family)
MILSTTPSIDGKKAVKYLGLVSGDAILDANLFLGANAVVGIDIDYETIGASASMWMVSASGTVVVVEPE